eukprot:TRINITY_DN24168_c0_g1_i1.p1 TRINITY_DN24168_c0_g1~~TRINITY_DN24168_c0_g1_i1.p1  ORF type:complete len:1134 (-),score=221.02 TRINITY_DN24168_c0_g1_i1:275-3676(-)
MPLVLSRLERHVLAGLAVLAVGVAVAHEAAQLRALGVALQGQFFEDYYAILGVDEAASENDIKSAFKRAQLKIELEGRQSEESKLRKAKLSAAHDTLADPEARASFDRRRQAVLIGGYALVALAGLGAASLLVWLLSKCASRIAKQSQYGVDGRSLEGRALSLFSNLEVTLDICLERESVDSSLGLRLAGLSTRSGDALQIVALSPETVATAHNARERQGRGDEPAWWNSGAIWAGDVLVAVNGQRRVDDMMGAFQSATTMTLTVRRSRKQQAILPWLTEAELQRKPGDRWGCQMSPAEDGSATLEITSIDAVGSVATWNRQHPQLSLRVGDRLAAVNGKLGANAMLNGLREAERLESRWMILRGVLASPPPPETVCGPFHRRGDEKLGLRIGPALESRVNGVFVEPNGGASFVVKEVRAGYLVDSWNQHQPLSARVQEGAIVLSVNDVTVPERFVAELAKPVVRIRTRMPLGANGASAAPDNAANLSTLEAPLSAPTQSQSVPSSHEPPRPGLLQSISACFFKPVSFEDSVRKRLLKLRYEFDVKITREADVKVGISLKPADDDIGGLIINGVNPDSLVGRNAFAVKDGDRLTCVNGISSPGMMVELLSDQSVPSLNLHFSRKAIDASPGLWEAEIERRHGEGWGMELHEAMATNRGENGLLGISNVSAGLAIDRWNQECVSKGLWQISAGDCVVAVEPEVEPRRMLEVLKSAGKVKVMILRWHSGPAPSASTARRPPPSQPATPTQPAYNFEVTLEKMTATDRLGLRLEPSKMYPSRTSVAEVLAGGLVDTYNRRTAVSGGPEAATLVRTGDLVDSVNGETDASRFAACCSSHRLRICFSRYSQQALPASSPVASVQEKAVAPSPVPPVAAQSVAPPVPSASTAPAAAPAPAAPVLQDAAQPPVPSPAPPAVSNGIHAPSAVCPPVSPQAQPPPEDNKKELFLMRTEMEQLRRRLAMEAENSQREISRLKNECDSVRKENDALVAEKRRSEKSGEEVGAMSQILERERREFQQKSNEAQQQLKSYEDEVARLRAELATVRAEAASQGDCLQESLHRASELADSHAKLCDENERLRASLMQRGNDVDARAIETTAGAGKELHDVREQLAQLQDLASSIHAVLAHEHDDDPAV